MRLSKYIALLLALAILSIAPAHATYIQSRLGLGGDGSDGALTKSGSESTAIYPNANTLTVSTGQIWNIISDTRVNCLGNMNVAGTINTGYGILGVNGAADSGHNGRGIGGGEGTGTHHGAGGGGFGGNGGDGGLTSTGITSGVRPGLGGRAYSPAASRVGSCGASGSWDNTTLSGIGGDGGSAGGDFEVYCGRTLTISGDIHINGGNGGNPSGGVFSTGGGGGSGGNGTFAAWVAINLTGGSITSNGGNGGNGGSQSSGSAAGGGGCIKLIAPTITAGSNAVASHGTVGANGGSAAMLRQPSAGSDGAVVALPQKPTLPLLALLDSSDAWTRILAGAVPSKRIGHVLYLDPEATLVFLAKNYSHGSWDYDRLLADLRDGAPIDSYSKIVHRNFVDLTEGRKCAA